MTDKSVVAFACERLYVNYLEQVVSYKGNDKCIKRKRPAEMYEICRSFYVDIDYRNLPACADRNYAPSLTHVRLETQNYSLTRTFVISAI